MFEYRIRDNEADVADVYLLPDLVFNNETGLADLQPTTDGRDLLAQDGLATGMIICLFTDKRLPDEMDLPTGQVDRKGWAGDTFDVLTEKGEAELGSLLWTLWPSYLNDDVKVRAIEYCEDALQPLIDQGAVERFEIQAEISGDQQSALILQIDAYSPNNNDPQKYRFGVLWEQTVN